MGRSSPSRLLGLELPPADDKAANGAATGAEFGACQGALAGRTVESLAGLPPMRDAEQLALMRTLTGGFPAAFQTSQEHFALLVLKALSLTLRSGTAPSTPLVYAQYGLVHGIAAGDTATAYRFGRLAMTLCRKPEHAASAGAVHFIVPSFLVHWRDALSATIEGTQTGLRLSLESGDLEYATYCASLYPYYRLYAGENLDELDESLQGATDLARRTGDVVNQGFCTILRQFIATLQGKTQQPGSLFDRDFDEARLRAMPYAVQTFAATAMTVAAYLAGNFGEALAAADACQPLPGNFFNSEHVFYRGLSLAQLARSGAPDRAAVYLDRAREAAKTMQAWAEGAPANHAARHALLCAELAAIEGNPSEAMDLYDRAIQLAADHGFTNQEALANELSAGFHLSRGRGKVARTYLMDAYYCYERWGVSSKLTHLKVQHPELFDGERRGWSGASSLDGNRATTVSSTRSRTSPSLQSTSFDLMGALRATQAIVTELVFEKLVERLMRTLLENAGAQRGALLFRRGEDLRIEATMSVDPDQVRVGLTEDLASGTEMASSVIEYVTRAPQIVVLDDAARDRRFSADPYVVRRQPKSILCAPLVHRGVLTGILYLENNLATRAFTPARTELLQFIAAQASAAFENSRLYSQVAHTTEQLQRANETLEAQVAARTEELRRALGEVWSEMDLARKLQTVLLPREPRLPGCEIAAAMLPASDVGGDYYDVISNGAGTGWLLIGDVSGHGVTAGLIMMMIQSAVRTAVSNPGGSAAHPSPAAMLNHVNACLWNNLQQMSGSQYMTITALKFDGKRVTYAGLHQDMLVYRAATQRIECVETHGAWIGVLEDLAPALEDRAFELEAGDVLVLFSDGLTEMKADSGGRLEVGGLVAKLDALTRRTTEPGAILKGILGPLTGKALDDDVTLVVVRYAPPRD